MVKHQKNFATGLLFLLVGLAFALGASRYGLGAAAEMGPGYLPMGLGGLLASIGVVVMMVAMRGRYSTEGVIGHLQFRPLVFVVLAVLAFGALVNGVPELGIPPMGLVAAAVALIVLVAFAGSEFRIVEVLVLATALCVFSYFVFVLGLDLPFHMWPRIK